MIRALFTFDQLMRAAESGMHAEEAFILNKVASVMARETLSGSVYSYKDVFDPKALMDNADTREFMLLPGLGYCKLFLGDFAEFFKGCRCLVIARDWC
jgi:hypothetical protein